MQIKRLELAGHRAAEAADLDEQQAGRREPRTGLLQESADDVQTVAAAAQHAPLPTVIAIDEFAALGIDNLLLEESLHHEPQDAGELEWYRAVFNVAGHYRWDMGLLLPGARFTGDLGTADARTDTPGIAFVFAPGPVAAPCVGRILDADFWHGAAPESLPEAPFHFAQIPLGVPPELVLDRLALWRAA